MEAFSLESPSEKEKTDLARSTKKVMLHHWHGGGSSGIYIPIGNGSKLGVVVEWRCKSSFKDILRGQPMVDSEMWDSGVCSIELSDDDSDCKNDELTDDDCPTMHVSKPEKHLLW